MPGLKYLYLTCLCLIIYSFIPANSDIESTEKYLKGNIIDNFSIEELLSPSREGVKKVPSDELHVRSAWIYKKGAGITPAGSEDRSYHRLFSISEARIICWELIMEHPPAPVNRDLNFEYTLHGADEQKIAEAVADSWIPAGSDLTEHSACWGSAYPGSWKIGDYRYTIRYKPEDTGEQAGLEQSIRFSIY